MGCIRCCNGCEHKPLYPVVIAVALTNSSGQILLGKRKNTTASGLLCTPGGRLEYNETIQECAAREFYEECGALLGPVTIIGYKRHVRYNDTYIVFYTHATSYCGTLRNVEPNKSEDWSWYSRWELTEENCTEPSDILDLLPLSS